MSEISHYLDYLECSLRSTFYRTKPKLSIAHAKAIALQSSANYFLTQRAANRPVTLEDMKGQLSTAWTEAKKCNNIEYTWEDLVSVQVQLAKVFRLVADKDVVLAPRYPTRLETSFDTIDGLIDAVILKDQSSLRIVCFDHTSFAPRKNDSPVLKLLASYYDMAIREAKLSRLPREYIFFRLVSGKIFRLQVTPYDDKKVIKVLRSIHRGLSHEIHPPTIERRVCRDCLYNTCCEWSHT